MSYSDHEQAMQAVDELNGTVVNNHTVYCGRAQKRKERQAELQRRSPPTHTHTHTHTHTEGGREGGTHTNTN